MHEFLVGHAAHPDWRAALATAAAQIESKRSERPPAGEPTLGFVYFSDRYEGHAAQLLVELRQRWPGVAWVGGVAVGVAASGVEYIDEPALAVMLAALPPDSFELYSGHRRLHRIEPFTALVHADPSTPDLADLIGEMSDRVASGYLFGGLSSSRGTVLHLADDVLSGGLSGVAFSRDVALISRVTQGCQPIGPVRVVTECERNIVVELDGEPALACLLRDIGLDDRSDPRAALARMRVTLAGLSDAGDSALAAHGVRQFGTDTRVRHLLGFDATRQAVAVAEMVKPAMRIAFCQRDVQAARRDLVRICSEIRDEVESQLEPATVPDAAPAAPPQHIEGAIYISCAGRGGPHFGAPSAEAKIVQHALGDVPLVGFFAGGEIARHHLYGYTGVLTVFTGPGG
jgi:small ligand-binding sensory domain FIST